MPAPVKYVLVDPATHWRDELWSCDQARDCAIAEGARVATETEARDDTLALAQHAEVVFPRVPGEWFERYDSRTGLPLTHWAPIDG